VTVTPNAKNMLEALAEREDFSYEVLRYEPARLNDVADLVVAKVSSPGHMWDGETIRISVQMGENKPAFGHDCEECMFLGQFDSKDLYYCKTNRLPTVIARFDNDPCAYLSGMQSAEQGTDPALREALRRAKKKGLVP